MNRQIVESVEENSSMVSDSPSRAGRGQGLGLGRREFLRRAAMLSASGILLLSPNAWAARALEGDSSRKRIVVIFLRGAVDGLNVVVPHGEPDYYDARPTIAIGQRGA